MSNDNDTTVFVSDVPLFHCKKEWLSQEHRLSFIFNIYINKVIQKVFLRIDHFFCVMVGMLIAIAEYRMFDSWPC